jgi:hypothetical protein
LLSVIKVILVANRTYAAHSGSECYLHGHRIYVPDGLNYPRQAWAGWGITCRTTATPEIAAAGSAAIGTDSSERPLEWCGWWMRQHLGGRYGPEFNVARNWLNAGRPLDGPRPGAIGVKAHHVFQVIQVVDRDHRLPPRWLKRRRTRISSLFWSLTCSQCGTVPEHNAPRRRNLDCGRGFQRPQGPRDVSRLKPR